MAGLCDDAYETHWSVGPPARWRCSAYFAKVLQLTPHPGEPPKDPKKFIQIEIKALK